MFQYFDKLISIHIQYSFVRFCTSRVEAIKYLMKEEEMNREELHKMREGLISDGWLSSPFLPQVYYSLKFRFC